MCMSALSLSENFEGGNVLLTAIQRWFNMCCFTQFIVSDTVLGYLWFRSRFFRTNVRLPHFYLNERKFLNERNI